VVDHEARVMFANEAANRLLGDGLSTSQGLVQASSRAHQGAFTRLMRSALRPEPEPGHVEPIALPRPSGRRPLLVQAIPVGSRQADWSMPDTAAALVIVIDPEQNYAGTAEKALRLLGLTRSEARLAALIGNGHTRAEAADTLGISESTASDTVKQVYAKLDLSRQSELVRLVDRLAVLWANSE
jgi:DNA-binding CsgD family transcriptional regulator